MGVQRPAVRGQRAEVRGQGRHASGRGGAVWGRWGERKAPKGWQGGEAGAVGRSEP